MTGTLSMQNAGLISGTFRAIDLGPHTSGPATGGLTLVNSGTITSSQAGGTTIGTLATLSATVNITNTGDILSAPGGWAVRVQTGTLTLANDGRIVGAVTAGSGADAVVNTGTILGSLGLGAGTNALDNAGRITGNVTAGNGDDRIVNTGEIRGNVSMGTGANWLQNAGGIASAVTGGDGADTVFNTGTIQGNVNLAGGLNVMHNAGTLVGEFRAGGSGKTDLINSGTISGDVVAVGLMADAFTIVNTGVITGNITADSRLVYIGRGGEVGGYILGSSLNDIYEIDNPATRIIEYFNGGTDLVRAWFNYALPSEIENLTLMRNDDSRGIGNALDNVIVAQGGDDTLYGGRGNDLLYGGKGNDLFGLGLGSDNDTIFGGDGNDSVQADFDADILFYGGAGNDEVLLNFWWKRDRRPFAVWR